MVVFSVLRLVMNNLLAVNTLCWLVVYYWLAVNNTVDWFMVDYWLSVNNTVDGVMVD